MKIKTVKYLTLIFGFLYLIYGIIESLSYFGRETTVIVSPTGDLFVGFVLLTISVIYLTGFKKALENDFKATSYLYAGSILSIGLAILSLLVIGADAIEAYLLKSEDFIGWSPLDDVTSYLVLGLLSIFAYLSVKDVSKKPVKV